MNLTHIKKVVLVSNFLAAARIPVWHLTFVTYCNCEVKSILTVLFSPFLGEKTEKGRSIRHTSLKSTHQDMMVVQMGQKPETLTANTRLTKESDSPRAGGLRFGLLLRG